MRILDTTNIIIDPSKVGPDFRKRWKKAGFALRDLIINSKEGVVIKDIGVFKIQGEQKTRQPVHFRGKGKKKDTRYTNEHTEGAVFKLQMFNYRVSPSRFAQVLRTMAAKMGDKIKKEPMFYHKIR